jgi:hypothetical protein
MAVNGKGSNLDKPVGVASEPKKRTGEPVQSAVLGIASSATQRNTRSSSPSSTWNQGELALLGPGVRNGMRCGEVGLRSAGGGAGSLRLG